METKIIPIEVGEDQVIHINATHFSGMTKDEAVEAMKADGISKDKDWAGKAHAASRKAVAEQRKVSEEQLETEAKAGVKERLAELNRVRAMSGVEPVADAEKLTTTVVNTNTGTGKEPKKQ